MVDDVMSIGEFAQTCGLTVKALHHYDERGLLVPAHVDPDSRYRTYTGAQLRDAITIKLLRDAGLPVAAVRDALADPARAIDDFRSALAEQRAVQDAALAEADRTPAALDVPVEVEERLAEQVHYAAVVQRVALDGSDNCDDRFDRGFAALGHALAAAGNPPAGPFWSSFAPAEEEGAAEIVLCWPVARAVPPDFTVDGAVTRVGTLPARRELAVRWMHPADVAADDPAQNQATHPAVVALLAELDVRGLNGPLAGLRQIAVVGDDGPVGVEVAVVVSS